MPRIDTPDFHNNDDGYVFCRHCPFTVATPDGWKQTVNCTSWHPYECPTRSTYDYACRFADEHPVVV